MAAGGMSNKRCGWRCPVRETKLQRHWQADVGVTISAECIELLAGAQSPISGDFQMGLQGLGSAGNGGRA